MTIESRIAELIINAAGPPPPAVDPVAAIATAAAAIRKLRRTLLVHPDEAEAMRTALVSHELAGLVKILESQYVDQGKAFLVQGWPEDLAAANLERLAHVSPYLVAAGSVRPAGTFAKVLP